MRLLQTMIAAFQRASDAVRSLPILFSELWNARGSWPEKRKRHRQAVTKVGEALLGRSVWLSRQVDSLGAIRRRRAEWQASGFSEWFHCLLHRFYGILASSGVGACFLMGPVTLSAGIGSMLCSVPSDTLGSSLLTVAEVLGGITGLLFAAIVFGIQFHGEKLGHAVFVVRYLARREGVLPIAATSLGVIGANVLVGLFAPQWLPRAAIVMAMLDIVLVPFILILALWLLDRLIIGVSGDFFEHSLKPGLAWEYQNALDTEMRQAQLMTVYERAVSAAGLRYSMAAGFGRSSRNAEIAFKLSRRGYIKDINVGYLDQLGGAIAARCPGYIGELALAPGDEIRNQVVLVLTDRRDFNDRHSPLAPITDHARQAIESMLGHVFKIGVASELDVVAVLAQFGDAITHHAKYDSAEQLTRALDVQRHLIEERLKRGQMEMSPTSLYRRRLPDFLGDFDYLDMAKAVAASGDIEKIQIVLEFSFGLIELAIDHGDLAMLARSWQVPHIIYSLAVSQEQLRDTVASDIDMRLNHVLMRFQSRQALSLSHFDKALAMNELPLVVSTIGWVLKLIKVAIEADRQQDAEDFHSRIFEFDVHDTLRKRHSRTKQHCPEAMRTSLDLHWYAQFALVGWCVHLAQDHGVRSEVLKSIVNRSLAECGSRHDVVRIWETVRTLKLGVETNIDTLLALDHWEEPGVRWRAGSYYVGSGPRAPWIETGFVAVALAKVPASNFDLPSELSNPPALHYEIEPITGKADNLVSNQFLRQELLNLDENQARAARDEFVALLRERLCLRKRADLTAAADTPLDPQSIEQLRVAVEAELTKRRNFLQLIQQLGGLSANAIHSCPIVRVWQRFPRANLVFGSQCAAELAPMIAEDVAGLEGNCISYQIVAHAEVARTLNDRSQLTPATRDVIALLRGHGREPSLILIPRAPFVRQALCGPARFAPDARQIEDQVGEFEGIPVVYCPFRGTPCIGVVDVGAFYGAISYDPSPVLQLTVYNEMDAENKTLVALAATESDPGRIPTPFDLSVQIMLSLRARAGVQHTDAAVQLMLNQAKLGFAMRRSEDVFHRPDCRLLEGHTDIEYSLVPSTGPNDFRTRCDTCKPIEWDGDD